MPGCMRDGCGADTYSFPVICMVAMGHERGKSPPVRFALPVWVCGRHQEEFNTDLPGLLTPDLRRTITTQMVQANKIPPNFDAAWLEFHEVDGPLWNEMNGRGMLL